MKGRRRGPGSGASGGPGGRVPAMDKAGDLLGSFISFYGLDKGRNIVSLFSGWRAMVGDDLASHTRPADVRRGAVVVEVDHPGWMQLLQMREEAILGKIGKKFPELGIRSLQMRLVPGGGFSAPSGGSSQAARPPRRAGADDPDRSEKRSAAAGPGGADPGGGAGPGGGEGPGGAAGPGLPPENPAGPPGKTPEKPAAPPPRAAMGDPHLRELLARLGERIRERAEKHRPPGTGDSPS